MKNRKLFLAIALISFQASGLIAMKRPDWAQDMTNEEYNQIVREFEQFENDRKKRALYNGENDLESDEALQIALEQSLEDQKKQSKQKKKKTQKIKKPKIIEEEDLGDVRLGCADKACAICLKDFKDNKKIYLLEKCRHAFCKKCFDKGLKIWEIDNKKPFCPCCRKEIVDQKKEIVCKLYKDLKPVDDTERKKIEKKRAKFSSEYEQALIDRTVAQVILSTNRIDFAPSTIMPELFFGRRTTALTTEDVSGSNLNLDETVLFSLIIHCLVEKDDELKEWWTEFTRENKDIAQKYLMRTDLTAFHVLLETKITSAVKLKQGVGSNLHRIQKGKINSSIIKVWKLVGRLYREILRTGPINWSMRDKIKNYLHP